MRILISNDDGYQAAGLKALFTTASRLGEPVVVAPLEAYSMKSHAITTGQRIHIEKRRDEHFGWCYICGGTPADCVRLALNHLPIGHIDVVLAGINHGANAGVDVFYSGTVAAAREATFYGKTGIAISQLLRPRRSDNWRLSTDYAAQALQNIWPERSDQPPQLFNINLPDPPAGAQLKGIRHCPLTTKPLSVSFEPPVEPHTLQQELRFTARYFDRPAPAGYDFHALLDNWITITPLRQDLTQESEKLNAKS